MVDKLVPANIKKLVRLSVPLTQVPVRTAVMTVLLLGLLLGLHLGAPESVCPRIAAVIQLRQSAPLGVPTARLCVSHRTVNVLFSAFRHSLDKVCGPNRLPGLVEQESRQVAQ